MRYLLLLAFLLSASAAQSATPTEPLVAWSKQSVKVCWGNDRHQIYSLAIREHFDFQKYSETQKSLINEIITKEYNLKDVGIEFTGWEDCNDRASNADIILFRFEPVIPENDGVIFEQGGRATIGELGHTVTTHTADNLTTHSYRKHDSPLKGYVILNTRAAGEKLIGGDNYLKIIALHEFGHSTGLRHQHVSMGEALKDSNCLRQPEHKLTNEPIFDSTVFTGAYDFNSIMNYCFVNTLVNKTGLNFRAKNLDDRIKLTDESLYTFKTGKNIMGQKRLDFNVRIGLSAMDKHALKCLYRHDEESKLQKCNMPLK